MWNHPTTPEDIYELFVKYCRDQVNALPWSDAPLSGESEIIRKRLAEVNAAGFLTINSQPAVDGVPSSHPVLGWGPRNGFVYQKVVDRLC